MQSRDWFPCPGCDRVVTAQVLGDGPANGDAVSRTHCCLNCERGLEHDSFWCAGTPGRMFREVALPPCAIGQPPELAHYLLHVPERSADGRPAPVLIWLHGALTFLYPETLHVDLCSFLDKNPKAREFIVIAPLAVRGEPLAVESEWRQKPDRFETTIAYVDKFDEGRTWDCFVAACRQLGPAVADFERLCVTGISMGAQAAWDLALRHGSQLAAAAPIAACCAWHGDAWAEQERIFGELQALPLRTYSVVADGNGYNWRDLRWIAHRRGDGWEPTLAKLEIEAGSWRGGPAVEAHVHSWGELLQLVLVHGHSDSHNCWDMVYQREGVFGMFEWMASQRNPRGLDLR